MTPRTGLLLLGIVILGGATLPLWWTETPPQSSPSDADRGTAVAPATPITESDRPQPKAAPVAPSEPTPPPTGFVATVLLADGSVSTEARLAAYRLWYGGFSGNRYREDRPLGIGRADENGVIRIEGLPPGTNLAVEVGAPGGVSRSFDVRALEEGEMRTLPPLDLDAGEEVHGVVRGPDGKPLPEVWVAAAHEGSDNWLNSFSDLSRTLTDGNGRYRLGTFRPGDTMVFAGGNGYLTDDALVKVAHHRPTEQDFTLTPALVYEGRVVDAKGQPVEGALVRLESREWIDRTRLEVTTDASGSFTMRNVPLSFTALSVRRGDHWWSTESNTYPHWLEEEEEAEADAEITPLLPFYPERIRLPIGGDLHLEVRNETGDPIAARVRANRKSDPESESESESAFQWESTEFESSPSDPLSAGLPIGAYELLVEAEGYAPKTVEAMIRPDRTARITLDLAPLPTEIFRVECRSESGDALPGLEVSWSYSAGESGWTERTATTSSAGVVTVLIPRERSSSEVYVLAHGAGWTPVKALVEPDELGGSPLELTVLPEAVIQVTTFDPSGRRTTRPHAWVFRTEELEEEWESTSEGNPDDGRRFSRLAGGSYSVSAELDGVVVGQVVHVAAGETRSVDIRFPPPTPLEVRVRVNGEPMTEGLVFIHLEPWTEELEYSSEAQGNEGVFRFDVPTTGSYALAYENGAIDIRKKIEVAGPTQVELEGTLYRARGRFVLDDQTSVPALTARFQAVGGTREVPVQSGGSFELEVNTPGEWYWSFDDFSTSSFARGVVNVGPHLEQDHGAITVSGGRVIRIRVDDEETGWYCVLAVTPNGPRTLLSSPQREFEVLIPSELQWIFVRQTDPAPRLDKLFIRPDQDDYHARLESASKLFISIDPDWRTRTKASHFRIVAPRDPSTRAPIRANPIRLLIADAVATVIITDDQGTPIAERTIPIDAENENHVHFP